MEFAAEKEETAGGGHQRVAEGARPRPEPGGESDLGGNPRAGEERSGLTGIKTTEDAEEIKMDLAVVKQEAVDWPEIDGGVSDRHWVKQEVEGGPEVKDEKTDVLEVKQEDSSLVLKEEKVDESEIKEEKVKVKEEADWEEVKEEDLRVKQELLVEENVKEEQAMDGVHVKEEDCLKREVMEDTKVKEERHMSPRVGCKRKLAMSR